MKINEIMPTDEEPIKVICGDCLEVMKQIPDNSVDLVLTDPPYGLRWKEIAHTHTGYQDLKNFDDINMKELYKDLFPVFNRIVKTNGSVIIFCSQKWAYYMLEESINNNFDFKAMLIWEKTNPVPQIRHRNYRSSFECILWFARWNEKKCDYTFNFSTQEEMKNLFRHPIVSGKERTKHPTQKPIKIIEKILKVHSNPNDLVLDCFLGSGTTAVACKQLGRKCIGIEISPEYCKIAKSRLAQEVLI